MNSILTATYWEIGKRIVLFEQHGEERAKYGEEVIGRLATDVTKRFGRGFTPTNLRYMRQFYLIYPDMIHHAARDESQEAEILEEENQERSLIHHAVSDESFTPIDSTVDTPIIGTEDRALVVKKDTSIILTLIFSEADLEAALIDHLEEFLLELGYGFCFVGRQKRITIDDDHYYVDLVMYHRRLKCLVLIDLKIGRLKHNDIGQMNFYLNYIKENDLLPGENPPIGIVLCAEKDEAVVRYALGSITNKVFASRYKLHLPDPKELERELEVQRFRIELKRRERLEP